MAVCAFPLLPPPPPIHQIISNDIPQHPLPHDSQLVLRPRLRAVASPRGGGLGGPVQALGLADQPGRDEALLGELVRRAEQEVPRGPRRQAAAPGGDGPA